MKRKLSLLLAFTTIMTLSSATIPTFAASENQVESIKSTTSTGTVNITLKIMGTDGASGKEGITAGDTFYIDTGKDTEITAINGEKPGSWADSEEKYPEKIYTRIGSDFKEIQKGKIDISETVQNAFLREGVTLKIDDAVLELGHPISLTKVAGHKLTVNAESRVEIEEKINKLIDQIAEKYKDKIKEEVNKLKADNKNITEKSVIENVKNIFKSSNTLMQYGVALDLTIKFDGASGNQYIEIDGANSTVTSTKPQTANVTNREEEKKDIEILFDQATFTTDGENEMKFVLSGGQDSFVSGRVLKFMLPEGFEWKEDKIKDEKAEITRNPSDKRELQIEFNGVSKREDKIEIITHIIATKDAKEGKIEVKVIAGTKVQGNMDIGEYKKTEIKPETKPEKPQEEDKVKTEFKIGSKNYYIIYKGIKEQKQMEAAPFAQDQRTMLPMRYIAEALGIDVKYDNSIRTAIFTKGDTKVTAQLDTKDSIKVNGKEIKLYTKMAAKEGRIFIPLANIAQAFGLEHGKTLIWNQEDKTVTVIR